MRQRAAVGSGYTANVRVKLNGHTLTVRSHRHKNGKRGFSSVPLMAKR